MSYSSVTCDFTPEQHDELAVRSGEIVKIIVAEQTEGWNFVENTNGDQGLIPANFTKQISVGGSRAAPKTPPESESEEEDVVEEDMVGETKCNDGDDVRVTLFDFVGSQDDELTVKAGIRVVVLEIDNDDWCLVDAGVGGRGVVPRNYLSEKKKTSNQETSAPTAVENPEEDEAVEEEEEAKEDDRDRDREGEDEGETSSCATPSPLPPTSPESKTDEQ